MDSEHRTLMTKSRELIDVTRREILELRDEIASARDTIDQSQRLLCRIEPSSRPGRMSRPKPLNLGRFGLM
jgi:hypothetical protein